MAQKRMIKSYDKEYNAQAVKLAQETGVLKATIELGVPKGTIYCWIKAFNKGILEATQAVHTPSNALTLNEKLVQLRKHIKE